MKKSHIGQISVEPGATPEKHELKTAAFLANFGYDVKFLKPIDLPHTHTPDIKINDKKYEIKAPQKIGKYNLDREMRDGLKQSENLIFDLRRLKSIGTRAETKLQKDFARTKKWRILWIITHDGKMLTLAK